MSDRLPPTGFWAYARRDDVASRGRLGQLRRLVADALQIRVGRTIVDIWQDVADISHGGEWERQIYEAMDRSSFFIPIITPGFVQSEWCCREVRRFVEREKALGRGDLMFPILYVDIDQSRRGEYYDPQVLALLQERQWIDRLASDIYAALGPPTRVTPRPSPPPEPPRPTPPPIDSLTSDPIVSAEIQGDAGFVEASDGLAMSDGEGAGADTVAGSAESADLAFLVHERDNEPWGPATGNLDYLSKTVAELTQAASPVAAVPAYYDALPQPMPPLPRWATARLLPITAILAVGGAAWWWRQEIADLVSGFWHSLSGRSSSLFGPASLAMAGATSPASGGRRSTTKDWVNVSPFAPERAAAGDTILVQVLFHRIEDATVAAGLATEVDPDAERQGVQTLDIRVPRGDRLDVRLEADDVIFDEPMQSLVWQGRPHSIQFSGRIAPGRAFGGIQIKVRVFHNGVSIGVVIFKITIDGQSGMNHPPAIRGDFARRAQRAFISYSSEDRSAVTRCAQALEAAGISVRQDILVLDPGKRWAQRLFEEIDRCDTVLLFWSKNAAASEWVKKEVNYALDRQKTSAVHEPEVKPVVIGDPPVPLPPDEWKHLHFNDKLYYMALGVDQDQAARSATRLPV